MFSLRKKPVVVEPVVVMTDAERKYHTSTQWGR